MTHDGKHDNPSNRWARRSRNSWNSGRICLARAGRTRKPLNFSAPIPLPHVGGFERMPRLGELRGRPRGLTLRPHRSRRPVRSRGRRRRSEAPCRNDEKVLRDNVFEDVTRPDLHGLVQQYLQHVYVARARGKHNQVRFCKLVHHTAAHGLGDVKTNKNQNRQKRLEPIWTRS